MTSHNESPLKQEPTLLGIKTCHKAIFPNHEEEGPGLRTFLDWKAKKYFPSLKIGKRVFLDPVQVRKALEKKFTIEAAD
jgi:hypothetical protein